MLEQKKELQRNNKRDSKIHIHEFKLDRNDEVLKTTFAKIANSDRLTRAKLRERLQQRYGQEIGDGMVAQLSKFFNEFITEQKLENYIKAIETFLNQEEEDIKRFIFDIYDTPVKLNPRSDSPPKRAGKINEWGLFKLMAIFSSKPAENAVN